MNRDNDDTSTLYVDLDGTFIKPDMLFESLLIAIKNNPLIILSCVIWLAKGKSFLKHKLANITNISIKDIPLNQEFFEFLLQEKN